MSAIIELKAWEAPMVGLSLYEEVKGIRYIHYTFKYEIV
jgi:hypothetical protein